jgi:ADP-ribosylglycohydrolase
MILAIAGDILSSSIESTPFKPKFDEIDLEKLAGVGQITDDSVMTLATCQWWIDYKAGRAKVKDYIDYLREFFTLNPNVGYGPMFYRLMSENILPEPPSCGNGAAMRISPLGISPDHSMDKIMNLVEALTYQSHKHSEAIKGAKATVYAMKRLNEDNAAVKKQIQSEIEERFGYKLNLDYKELLTRPFDATCQGSVPQALWCALTSENIDEMFKKALTIGGDSDTIACIAGGVFEAGMPTDKNYTGSIDYRDLAETKIAHTRESKLQTTYKAALEDDRG